MSVKVGMKQSKKIAVTGGIGSGKSTVMKIIAGKGYPIFSCDEIYSQLTSDSDFLNILRHSFGDILNSDGTLDRKKLSEIVFNNPAKLAELDKITHPAIYKEMFRMADEAGGICFCEVPLLFESGAESLFDGVIIVMRNEEQRIKSVTARDKLPEQDVKKRISNQFDYNSADFAMYYVIHNNGDLSELEWQTEEIIKKINEK